MNSSGNGGGIRPLGSMATSTAGMDQQQLQEQQMIKTVHTSRTHWDPELVANMGSDANSNGIVPRENSHVRCDGFRPRWSIWSFHVFGKIHHKESTLSPCAPSMEGHSLTVNRTDAIRHTNGFYSSRRCGRDFRSPHSPAAQTGSQGYGSPVLLLGQELRSHRCHLLRNRMCY